MFGLDPVCVRTLKAQDCHLTSSSKNTIDLFKTYTYDFQTREVQRDGRPELRRGGAGRRPPGEAAQRPGSRSPHRAARVRHRLRRHAVPRRRGPGDRLLSEHHR